MMEPPPPHAPGGVLDGEERPDEVHVDHPLPLGQVGVDDRDEGPDARIGEGDVRGAEPVLGGLEERIDVGLLGDVTGQADHTLEAACHLGRGVAVDVPDHHACPLGDEAAHRGEADSRRATGHDGDLPYETSLGHGARR